MVKLSIPGEVIGRDLRLVEVPEEAVRAGTARYGMPPEVVDAVMRRTLESGRGAGAAHGGEAAGVLGTHVRAMGAGAHGSVLLAR